jgi:DNA polymerase III epsilon subunit family exonuclease
MSNYIYISIETTGLEVKEERIVEIATLKINSKTKLKILFQQYFNPQKKIDASASGIKNLTNSFLKDCPIISEKIDSFLEFIKSCNLIMLNKSFIMKFLDKELNLVKKILTSNKAIDIQDLARVRFPNEI